MEFQQYIQKQSEFYYLLLDFIDCNNEDESNQIYEKIISYLANNKTLEKKDDLQELLYLISNISYNHHRTKNFFDKFEKIILHLKNALKLFTNSVLFDIFKFNKRILMFLFTQKIVIFDDDVQEFLFKNFDEDKQYFYYFYPEIKSHIDDDKLKKIEEELQSIDNDIFTNFETNRQIGENDSYLCELIRQDLVKEFIIYVNKNNIKLSSHINESIFETNEFLIADKVTLIEYATFFGSLQIFQYLQLNNVDLTPSLWLYSVHGRNPFIIHILEENHVDYNVDELIEESIKCHHNELTEYFKNTLLNDSLKNDEYNECILQNLNYSCFHFMSNYNDLLCFASFCNYFKLVKVLLQIKDININHHYVIFKKIL